MKNVNKFKDMTLEALLKKEWSSRHQNKYFACPSCGARWYIHHEGCKLELAIKEKQEAKKAEEAASEKDSG